MSDKRILVFGAGVIGSTFAALFSSAGHDITIYARGERYVQLKEKGLLYIHETSEGDELEKADVRVIDKVEDDDIYDYILVAVRFEQVDQALKDLSSNKSKTVVTMVNTAKGYEEWEEILGKGRLLPAFPGCGGTIDEKGVLRFAFTPQYMQPTTFGELCGHSTPRLKDLSEVFFDTRVPYAVCHDMEAWQKTHTALVVALAHAVYEGGGTARTAAKNDKVMKDLALELKNSFKALKRAGVKITPSKFNSFTILPIGVLQKILKNVFAGDFAEVFITPHALKAREEMAELEKEMQKIIGGQEAQS